MELVDDNTKFMGVYLVKQKLVVVEVIIEFCQMIKNQYGTMIKIF